MMRENTPRPTYAPLEEAQADEFIWTNPEAARLLLDQGIDATLDAPELDRERYHRLVLKRTILPLYELAAKGIDDERIDKALDVYGLLVELLADELHYFAQIYRADEDARKSKGRITEIAVQALTARDLQHEDPAIVLLLATQDDDVFSKRLGTDYYLTSIRGQGDVIYPIQLKNRLTEDWRDRYRPPINTIGLDQIDPYYYNQLHSDSLSNMMLRELNGEGTEEEVHVLNMATLAFYSRVTQQSKAGFIEHPTKKGWLKLPA